jgi:hypothetical protein
MSFVSISPFASRDRDSFSFDENKKKAQIQSKATGFTPKAIGFHI